MGLMFPERARTAAEASGGTSDPLANPCPPVLARKVLRFSLETWWWGRYHSRLAAAAGGAWRWGSMKHQDGVHCTNYLR